MKTTQSFSRETVPRRWYVVDLEGRTLGRAAARIAQVLRGKHKPEWTPHTDVGDFVVVVNADKVVLTGSKPRTKHYYWHTGYFGGLKSIRADRMLQQIPERAVKRAVWGMIPRGPLGRRMFKKLKVYAGPEHPHRAQQPEPLDLDGDGR